MAENERHALILTDANILIDYASSGIDVLRLVSDHLAPVVVPDVVFQEVRELTLDMAESVGVTVLETPLWLMTSGTEVSRPLSFEDQVCLEMASRSGWTCATNDRVLRRECALRGVRTVWGLELMVLLVQLGVLSLRKAENVARKMQKANPNSITAAVLDGFVSQIHQQ